MFVIAKYFDFFLQKPFKRFPDNGNSRIQINLMGAYKAEHECKKNNCKGNDSYQ